MKIAFVQPFGIASPGGGPRIMRTLLRRLHCEPVIVCTSPGKPARSAEWQERHIGTRPDFRRLERTRLSPRLYHLEAVFRPLFRRRLNAVLSSECVDVIHAIPQGTDFYVAFLIAKRMGVPFILNVHDDVRYTTYLHPDCDLIEHGIGETWRQADGRFVISDEIGVEYSRRYGERPYTTLTDGAEEVTPSQEPVAIDYRIYFAGTVLHAYSKNFECLFNAQKHLCEAGFRCGVTTRGGVLPRDLSSFASQTLQLPFDENLKLVEDVEDADFVYLPLPFEEEHQALVRYSLPTKLISYLQCGRPIIYHGPRYSPANRILSSANAAICIHSQDPREFSNTLLNRTAEVSERARIVQNARELLLREFTVYRQVEKFHGVVDLLV